MYSTNKLEMFTLNTWINNIDVTNNFKDSIKDINESKNRYNNRKLQLICHALLNEQYQDSYKIFTDGAKYGNSSGLAFLDWQTGEFIKLKIVSNTSIMFTEMVAILEALSYIQSVDYNKFVILTDSKSAIQHLTRCTFNFRGVPLGYEIIDAIIKFKNVNKHVVIQWIPSHVGIPGNEEVDRLAKLAATEDDIYDCLPMHTDLLYQVKKDCLKSWSEYFDERSRTKGIWYKIIQSSIPRSIWFKDIDMNRNDLTTAFRLRSGQIPLNSFGFMMNKVDTPNCTVCNVVEDVYHIIMECSRTEEMRQKLQLPNYDMGHCNCILMTPNSKEAKLLYKFVQLGIKKR